MSTSRWNLATPQQVEDFSTVFPPNRNPHVEPIFTYWSRPMPRLKTTGLAKSEQMTQLQCPFQTSIFERAKTRPLKKRPTALVIQLQKPQSNTVTAASTSRIHHIHQVELVDWSPYSTPIENLAWRSGWVTNCCDPDLDSNPLNFR
jgi:hypothetical protein